MTTEFSDKLLYEGTHIIVRSHVPGEVTIATGRQPSMESPVVVSAEGLRDALDEYIEETDSDEEGDHEVAREDLRVDVDDEDSGASVTDLEVEVDVDLSDTREAIESLQADVEDLNVDIEGLRENLAALTSHSFGDADYDLPAPSPSDVRERAGVTEEDEADDSDDAVTLISAEPLYELAEDLRAGDSENQEDEYSVGFVSGQDNAGRWLKGKLDELTEEAVHPDPEPALADGGGEPTRSPEKATIAETPDEDPRGD